jgi:hypothetical protein
MTLRHGKKEVLVAMMDQLANSIVARDESKFEHLVVYNSYS